MEFSHIGKASNGESEEFKLKSKGTIGDSTRVVESKFTISLEGVMGNMYKLDTNLVISPSANPSQFPFPNSGSSLKGPLVTNKPIVVDKDPVVSGPIVTNQPMTFKVAGTWTQARLITSSELFLPRFGLIFLHTQLYLKGIRV